MSISPPPLQVKSAAFDNGDHEDVSMNRNVEMDYVCIRAGHVTTIRATRLAMSGPNSIDPRNPLAGNECQKCDAVLLTHARLAASL